MTENSKKTIPVLVSGALGRMGSEVVNTVLNSIDCELVAAIDINKKNNGKNISELLNLKSARYFHHYFFYLYQSQQQVYNLRN